ncbi:cupin domain-containing protein [Hippea alviniae]|uniref:cupin domain-containing protein n=1 Tax=Hippea alviniae TaxID=1279027 RepID=UPI00047D6352|nr:cupin domain-containing protein [Hippea alviniae]
MNMNKKNRVSYENVKPYTTKDGSIIRELIHPNHMKVKNISLAEAIVKPNEETFLHIHKTSEEIYHITEGKGVMQLGDKTFEVKKGDSILIPPKTPHKIKNNSQEELKILCICSPPYSHEDTELL